MLKIIKILQLYAVCSIKAYERDDYMPVKAITIRVDDAVKEQAEIMLEDMGMNMTTYVVSSLKALVREKRIPFDMVTTHYLNDQIILKELSVAETEAVNPGTKWLNHDEVFKKIRKRYNYEV